MNYDAREVTESLENELSWGAESNEKLPNLFIPSKTAAQVPKFAVEDLPLGRIAALVPEFAVKDLMIFRTGLNYDITTFEESSALKKNDNLVKVLEKIQQWKRDLTIDFRYTK